METNINEADTESNTIRNGKVLLLLGRSLANTVNKQCLLYFDSDLNENECSHVHKSNYEDYQSSTDFSLTCVNADTQTHVLMTALSCYLEAGLVNNTDICAFYLIDHSKVGMNFSFLTYKKKLHDVLDKRKPKIYILADQ